MGGAHAPPCDPPFLCDGGLTPPFASRPPPRLTSERTNGRTDGRTDKRRPTEERRPTDDDDGRRRTTSIERCLDDDVLWTNEKRPTNDVLWTTFYGLTNDD